MDDYCNSCGRDDRPLSRQNNKTTCSTCLSVDERHAKQEASGFTPIYRKRYFPK